MPVLQAGEDFSVPPLNVDIDNYEDWYQAADRVFSVLTPEGWDRLAADFSIDRFSSGHGSVAYFEPTRETRFRARNACTAWPDVHPVRRLFLYVTLFTTPDRGRWRPGMHVTALLDGSVVSLTSARRRLYAATPDGTDYVQLPLRQADLLTTIEAQLSLLLNGFLLERAAAP